METIVVRRATSGGLGEAAGGVTDMLIRRAAGAREGTRAA